MKTLKSNKLKKKPWKKCFSIKTHGSNNENKQGKMEQQMVDAMRLEKKWIKNLKKQKTQVLEKSN